jgi:arylsulfatase A-like enzyme
MGRIRPTNVVVVMLDDVGFAHLGCYGSDIHTPAIDRLAERGLQYTNFHATPMCSPSRAALLTGRNCHSVGMGIVAEYATDHPGYRGSISPHAGTVAEILQEQSVNTLAVGKWHVMPSQDQGFSGPFTHWPTNRGFNHFFGFMGAESSQWHPELVDGHTFLQPEDKDGPHLSERLIDRAIEYVSQHAAAAQDEAFFLYLAPGAAHAPLHAPREYIERYRGLFDDGWDEARKRVLHRQIERGLVPPDTDLAARNPGVLPWDELDDRERRLFARMQEVFAGFVEHTDAQLARLVAHLETLGLLDDTLIVVTSDNGASGEGGPVGTSELIYHIRETSTVDSLEPSASELGSSAFHNHYPAGWAQVGNTPLKWYKRQTYGGGIRSPFVVHWPNGFEAAGELRSQYHHLIDVTPTVLDILGVNVPATIKGAEQMPLDGTSMRYSFDGDGESRRHVQYYEMLGNRAIWVDGWKAVAYHEPGSSFEDDEWELYHVDSDFSETHNLAPDEPKRLRSMMDLWWAEAGRFNVLPLNDSMVGRRFRDFRRQVGEVTLWDGAYVPAWFAPGNRNIPAAVTAATVRGSAEEDGVIIALGGNWVGYSLYVKDNRLTFEYHYYGVVDFEVSCDEDLPLGDHTLGFVCEHEPTGGAWVRLTVDGAAVASQWLERIIPFTAQTIGAMEVGRDRNTPVSRNYESPFRFAGKLGKVTVKAGPMSRGPSTAEIEFALAQQ